MDVRNAKRALVVAFCALWIVGCQTTTAGLARAGAFRARALASAAPPPPADAAVNEIYEHAVDAIDDRAYGRALDLLQAARDAAPNDPRVLTAMGVVYDKLGRFDLSKRYYDLAEAADPKSPVVAKDRAYSQVLEARLAAVRPPAALAPESFALEPGVRSEVRLAAVMAASPVFASERPDITADLGRIETARPLGGVRVINATGRSRGDARIRAHLLARGWTVRKEPETAVAVSPTTVLRFPASREVAARGLARTLRVPVRLEACSDCRAIELSLGADAVVSLAQAQSVPGGRG